MAILEKLIGTLTLREAWRKIDRNEKAINDEIVNHKASTQAHDATAIKYDGKVVGAGNTKQAIDNVQEQVNTLVLNGDSSAAAAQAAIDANGHDYQNLKRRLDTEHTQLSEQLADTTQKTTDLDATKASKADLLTQAARIDNLVANAGDTDGNAELEDIRVTANGTIEPNAGEAVRKQYRKAENTARTGIVIETKTEALLKYDHYKDGNLLRADNTSIGRTLDAVASSGSGGAVNMLIDVRNINTIAYPVFKTSSGLGCLMVDQNNIVIWAKANSDLETGTIIKVDVPTGAKYFLLSVSASLNLLDWHLEYPSEIKTKIDNLYKTEETMGKTSVLNKYGKYEDGYYVPAIGSIGKNLADLNKGVGAGAYLIRIDISDYSSITYPLFKSSSGFGSVIVDTNNVVIWEHSETIKDTGSTKEILIPAGAKYFILGISASLSSLEWSITISKDVTKGAVYSTFSEFSETNLTPPPDITRNENRNLTLAALKTDILDNKIPYHRGYLFHKLSNDDKSLWYGTDFNNVSKIGTVAFTPRDCMLAVSPKDGRVIATKRNEYGSLFVWDGKTTFELFKEGSPVRPKGWLYNAGVEFTKDANGTEYCLFAEYSNYVDGQLGGFHVWRGTHPYTNESDWQRVFYQDYAAEVADKSNSVDHFHQIRRDPWTNILYLTSGDVTERCKWWYSLDDGQTWVLLTTGDTSGFEDHTCRTINFVFTKDYAYWATDYGTNHTLNQISRNETTGILDVSTRLKLTDLPVGRATNSICYVDSPKGLFLFDRVDYGFPDYYADGFDVLFWSLETNTLETVTHVKLLNNDWGGHRGKCYTNYTSGFENRPAMGFSDDTRCNFDVVSPNPNDIGTVLYEIKNGVMRFLTY